MDISTMMNVVTTQYRRYYINLLMNVFAIMNVSNPQHRVYDDDYSMNVFNIVTALMVQLGTSCSFDSPGLARNEPTPGKHSQGDSTL
ncbi:tetrahydrofolate synthase [Segatella salivae]|nr:tetrahydrofolate synthase [Segatella salivae]